MNKPDDRQTQDERTIDREKKEDAREEYTTYREEEGEPAGPGGAAPRREADLQPAPAREGEPDQEPQTP